MVKSSKQCFCLVNSCLLKQIDGYLMSDPVPVEFVDSWDKVFKNGPSKICGRQSLKNSK